MIKINKLISNKFRKKIVHSKDTYKIFLLLILLLALFLRLYGISWGLPNEEHIFSYHPDERNILFAASNIDLKSYDFNPNYFYYPTFHTYLFITISHVIFNKIILTNDSILIGRLITVFFGVLSVYLMFLIGTEFQNEKLGLISALIFSISPIHVVHSHFLTNDVPVTFWILAAIFCSLKIISSKKTKWFILAGITGGLGISTKYTAGLITLPIVTAWLLGYIRRDQKLSRTHSKNVFLSLFILAFTFIITSPFVLLSFSEFARDITQISLYLNSPNPEWFDTGSGWIYHIRHSIYYGIGAPLLLLSFIGMIYSVRKNVEKSILLFSFIIPYLFWVGRWEARFARFILPLIPLFLLFAAFALVCITSKYKVIGTVILLLTLLSTSMITATYELNFINQDPRDSAQNWIEGSIPNNTTIGLLPTFQTRYKFFLPPLNNYNLIYTLEISELKDRNIEYFIISDMDYRYYMKSEKSRKEYPSEVEFIDYLFSEKDYKLVKTFNNKQKFLFIDLSDVYLPHDMKYTNPEITIFKKS